ncbi:MAG: RNA polymerase sigma factor [Candidatus Riflebacteria bacterium]|nr:RNA polymerase sigma factor [Candidatus Riflebacteria bacterium]
MSQEGSAGLSCSTGSRFPDGAGFGVGASMGAAGPAPAGASEDAGEGPDRAAAEPGPRDLRREPLPGPNLFDGLTFELVVDRYASPLRRFFSRRIRDLFQAENLVQETFFRVFRYADSFAGGGKLSAWVYGIASNLVRDLVRKDRRTVPVAPLDDSAPPTSTARALSPHCQAEDREFERALLTILVELKPRYRTVFILKHHYGLTYAQVGTALRISEGTVKSRMHKATRLVAQKLARRGFLPGGSGPR